MGGCHSGWRSRASGERDLFLGLNAVHATLTFPGKSIPNYFNSAILVPLYTFPQESNLRSKIEGRPPSRLKLSISCAQRWCPGHQWWRGKGAGGRLVLPFPMLVSKVVCPNQRP